MVVSLRFHIYFFLHPTSQRNKNTGYRKLICDILAISLKCKTAHIRQPDLKKIAFGGTKQSFEGFYHTAYQGWLPTIISTNSSHLFEKICRFRITNL